MKNKFKFTVFVISSVFLLSVHAIEIHSVSRVSSNSAENPTNVNSSRTFKAKSFNLSDDGDGKLSKFFNIKNVPPVEAKTYILLPQNYPPSN